MYSENLTIFIGDPKKAKFLIASSKTSAQTPGGKVLYPSFQIFADTPTVHGDINMVTVKSKCLTDSEEILVMRSLTGYCGSTGDAARQFFYQKVSP